MTFVKILFGLILLGVVMFFFLGMQSKKGSAKGLVGGQLAPCSSTPNCACSEAGTSEAKIVEALSGTMADAKAAIVSLGGEITSESDEYVSAVFTSQIFKFVDDVELRLADNGQIHVRSASRVGYSDRGVNKKRVSAIRSKMNG